MKNSTNNWSDINKEINTQTKYINLLEEHLHTKLSPNDYTLITKWRDYDVIIYNNTVFRFPKKEQTREDMKQEKQKLDAIAPYISYEIPRYTLINDTYISYPLIQSITLDEIQNPYTDTVINDIITFIKQLHAIPLEIFSFLSSPKEQTDEDKKSFSNFVENFKQEIEKKLIHKVRIDTIQGLHKYMDELFFTYESPVKAFIHTDLQGKNIIYNQETQHVQWIVDFSDSRIGGIENDFCHFYDISPKLLEKCIRLYLGNFDKAFYDRVFFLTRKGVLYEITNDEIYTNRFEYILEQLEKYKFL